MRLIPAEADNAARFHWWWRDLPATVTFKWGELTHQDFVERSSEVAFWYELEARGNGYGRDRRPHYRHQVPFLELTLEQVLSLDKWYPVSPMTGLPLIPLPMTTVKQFGIEVDDYFACKVNLHYPDTAILKAWKKFLADLREEKGVPSPAQSPGHKPRTASTGPSFSPVEALDVLRFSSDQSCKNRYSKHHSNAKKKLAELAAFTMSSKERETSG